MSKFLGDLKEVLDGIKAWVESRLTTKADASTTYSKTEVDSKLGNKADSSALTSHTGNSTIHVTSSDKSTWNGKYSKPSTGIPKTDLASGVQSSLGLADSAVQPADLADASVAYADESGYATAAGTASSASSVAWGNVTGKPTFGTASAKDVPASGNASTSQVVMGNDTRLTDTRTPKAHTHAISEVTNLQSSLNAKYEKPSGGIPKTDLASAVQTSLGKADSSVQPGDLASASVAYATNAGTAINAKGIVNSSGTEVTLGNSTKPVYLSNGAFQECTAYSSASVNYATTAGTATNAENLTLSGTAITRGNSTTPVFFTLGVPIACTPYSSASVNYANSAGTANAVDVDNLTGVTWMDAEAVEEYLNG